jgi:MFS family permease
MGLAFRWRSFRVFMAGSFVSWAGDWMDLAALNWAVLTLTGSPLALGLINACRLVPVFALSLPAGVLADRHDRRKLLMALQAGVMVLTFVVGGLVAVRAPFWLFAVTVTVRSVLAAMTPPVRNALVSNLVPAVALPSAVASQTAVMNLARIVGPAVAGLLLVLLPMEGVFFLNGASFALVLLTLAVLRPEAREPVRGGGRVGADVREALTYVRQTPAIQSLLVLAVVPMVFGFPYSALMPLFARDLLGLGPEGFGLLLSAAGVGALGGSVWLALRRRGLEGAGRWLVLSVLAFGLALLGFVAAPGFVLAAAAVFFVGLSSQVYRTMSRITLQVEVPDRLRGRILSVALMDRGLIPLGAVLLGAVAEWAGTVWAGSVMGGGCIVVTLGMLAVRRQIWHIGAVVSPAESARRCGPIRSRGGTWFRCAAWFRGRS